MKDLIHNIYKKDNAIGGTVIIANKNEILKHITYGYQSVENNIETHENTIYRIASISKVVVATAVMTLYDEGLVDIDEDISKYLGFKLRNPNFLEDPITIKMLMTQTSSLCDGSDEKLGYDGVNGPRFFVDLEKLLTDPTYEYYTDKTFLKYKPGTKFCYSNFGCGILACIVEKVTNKYFTDYVREKVLLPLGLDASFRIDDIKNFENVATLYISKNKEMVPTRTKEKFLSTLFPRYELGNNFRGPAGGLFISPKDLTIFMQMLMNEGTYQNIQILKPSTVQLMKEIHFVLDEKDGMYEKKGLQLLILDKENRRLYGHTGSAYGLRSFMLFDDSYGYIFMCNGSISNEDDDSDVASLRDKCLDAVLQYK